MAGGGCLCGGEREVDGVCQCHLHAAAAWRQEAAEAVGAGQENENEDSDDNEEMEDVPVRVPHRRARGPAVVPQLALDPGMWMNMVNVKPPYCRIWKLKA